MNQVTILGIKINEVTKLEAIELVSSWIKKSQKKYVTTPNIEFIMAAQLDHQFKKVLNDADLAIPDSSRFGWTIDQLTTQNWLTRLIKWPLFFLPKSKFIKPFPVVPGTDLMHSLIKEAAENNWSIGLLGGKDGVAEKLKQKLERKYPELQITYADSGGVIDENGEVLWVEESMNDDLRLTINDTTKKTTSSIINRKSLINIPQTDILFVAFGQVKQEKWIAKNLNKQPVTVMMGVGGAFDYLSGEVVRAPKTWQNNGFEWLYRLIQQPWRAKRFLSLIKFTFLVLRKK